MTSTPLVAASPVTQWAQERIWCGRPTTVYKPTENTGTNCGFRMELQPERAWSISTRPVGTTAVIVTRVDSRRTETSPISRRATQRTEMNCGKPMEPRREQHWLPTSTQIPRIQTRILLSLLAIVTTSVRTPNNMDGNCTHQHRPQVAQRW